MNARLGSKWILYLKNVKQLQAHVEQVSLSVPMGDAFPLTGNAITTMIVGIILMNKDAIIPPVEQTNLDATMASAYPLHGDVITTMIAMITRMRKTAHMLLAPQIILPVLTGDAFQCDGCVILKTIVVITQMNKAVLQHLQHLSSPIVHHPSFLVTMANASHMDGFVMGTMIVGIEVMSPQIALH